MIYRLEEYLSYLVGRFNFYISFINQIKFIMGIYI